MSTLLRDQRELRGLTLSDVCARLDVHPTTLLRWERRERLPDPSIISTLAGVLELDVATVSGFFDQAREAQPTHDYGVRGHGLRWLRDSAHLSARSVARQVGVPTAHIYNWESGRARVPTVLVPALARAFGLRTDALIALLRAAPTTMPPRSAPSPLRQLRQRAGVSQEHVAAALRISRRSVGQWEGGATVPLHALRRLAQLYAVPVSTVAKAAGVPAPHLLRPDAWAEGDLPEVLRLLRQWSGLTQPRLAELCGVSTGSIRGWEKGRTTPRAQSRARLEALYGLAPDALRRACPSP